MKPVDDGFGEGLPCPCRQRGREALDNPVVYRVVAPRVLTMPVPTPSYRLHKPSGQAVVTLSGKDHYLGRFGSPESRDAYDRLLAEWLANSRRPAPPPDDGIGFVPMNELRTLTASMPGATT